MLDCILNKVLTKWDGITIITGDRNINFVKESLIVTQYKYILQLYNLTQKIIKLALNHKLAIGHIITTSECEVKIMVLPHGMK